MIFNKKTWKDRVSEFPTRRTLTKSDGSSELVTVSRSEGDVSQEGDAFSAASMNDLEGRIDEGFTALNNDLTDCSTGERFRFAVSEEGKPGFWWKDKEGADAVIPFSSGVQLPYSPVNMEKLSIQTGANAIFNFDNLFGAKKIIISNSSMTNTTGDNTIIYNTGDTDVSVAFISGQLISIDVEDKDILSITLRHNVGGSTAIYGFLITFTD
ncbi:MAG: hypothetical protein J1E83_12595 [Lachnospiraceae bacterium]|nr:hypothetical protein [Lachnospiraceae bacterium]